MQETKNYKKNNLVKDFFLNMNLPPNFNFHGFIRQAPSGARNECRSIRRFRTTSTYGWEVP